MKNNPKCNSAYWLYTIRVLNGKKHEFMTKMKEAGINLSCHYIPIHTQPYYASLGFKVGDFPFSEAYYKRTVSLPVHPSLTSKKVELIIKMVNDILI